MRSLIISDKFTNDVPLTRTASSVPRCQDWWLNESKEKHSNPANFILL